MPTDATVETSSLTSAEGIPSVEGISLRRCIVTGEALPKSKMVRFVIAPDGVVTPDVKGNLPGRGLWLTARRDMVDKACAKELFSKVGRCRVTLGDDLSDRAEALLAHRCLSLLGISRRAGLAVAGHDKVRAAPKVETKTNPLLHSGNAWWKTGKYEKGTCRNGNRYKNTISDTLRHIFTLVRAVA